MEHHSRLLPLSAGLEQASGSGAAAAPRPLAATPCHRRRLSAPAFPSRQAAAGPLLLPLQCSCRLKVLTPRVKLHRVLRSRGQLFSVTTATRPKAWAYQGDLNTIIPFCQRAAAPPFNSAVWASTNLTEWLFSCYSRDGSAVPAT